MERIQEGQGGNGAGPHAGNGGGKPEPRKGRKNGVDKGDDKLVGRQDGHDGQEAVVDLGALKKGMPKAIKLEKDLADQRTDASNFYKKFAKECGLNTAQLRAAAKAYANEEAEAVSRKAEQMSLIFAECSG